MKKKSIFFGSILFLGLGAILASFIGLNNKVVNDDNVISLSHVERSESTQILSTSNLLSETEGSSNDRINVSLTTLYKTDLTESIGVRISLNKTDYIDNDDNYYLYYINGNEVEEAVISYEAKNNRNKTISGTAKLNLNTNKDYGFGSVMGRDTCITTCDITLPYDYNLITDSLKLINYYKADVIMGEDGKVKSYLPDLSTKYETSLTKATSFKEQELSSFIDAHFISLAQYSNYSAIKLNFDSYGKEIYPSLKSRIYRQNQEKIENGDYYIRTRFSIGGDTYFNVTLNDGSVITYSTSAGDVNISKDSNTVVFLIKDINASDIKDFTVNAFSIKVDLYVNATYKQLTQSEDATRFGTVSFRMQDILNGDGSVGVEKVDTSKVINYNVIYIIITIVFLACYIGASVGYYFYLKNKDKHNEFKILKTKEFVKTAILGYIALGSILYDFLYILNRSTSFKNSIAVYNPLDWLICVFSVLVICFGGYFIRYFYIEIKNKKEKKRRDKLNLNNDQSDDGIGIIKLDK